jgi:hypothetical protein
VFLLAGFKKHLMLPMRLISWVEMFIQTAAIGAFIAIGTLRR